MRSEVPFVIMAKPAGSACNMRCSYCYYLGRDHGTGDPGIMSEACLEQFIKNYIASAKGPVVSFTWHGGEPTLCGIGFYEKALFYQKKYLPEGFQCWNSLQTNGLILDDEWCSFIAREHFDVGLSIDGTETVHDLYRKDAAGKGTFGRIRNACENLLAHGVSPDLLCTVTSDSVKNAAAIYRSLRDMKTGWIQFIPIVRRPADADHAPAGVPDPTALATPDSVTLEGYGQFLSDVFAEWIFHDLGTCEVQMFSEMAMVLTGGEPSLCWMRRKCGNVLVVEADGGVYSCDHFVTAEHRIGTVSDELSGLVTSPVQTAFGNAKEETLCRECSECPYLPMCGGACPKDRFLPASDGSGRNKYYLCEGLKAFFGYSVPLLKEAMKLSAEGKRPEEIMPVLVRTERDRCRMVSRNDACPCGSGKKFKNCCLKRCP